MSHSWLAYLPPHLAADLLTHPTVSPLERVIRTPAIALFADISGFTPMSEALGQIGPHGTEELSHILNRIFGAMIARISAYGGSIGKFAGDALTVLFPTTLPKRQATLRRALQCALEMQADLLATPSIHTSAGTFSLAMKIGLGIGSLLSTTVGDPSIRLEYLLAGSAIDGCAEAEHHAPKGAVVLATSLLRLAGGVTAVPLGEGYHHVLRLHRRPALAPLPFFPPIPSQLAETLSRYVPPAIAQRIATGQHGFIDEHRLVTTLFVRFAGFDYQEPSVRVQVQTYLAAVVRIIEQYGGYLRQVEVGDKGSLYIVLFGAPLSHEDDAERALRCALELRALAQQDDIITATGITTGRVFCGLVGSQLRHEYAAIGDSVNLAARLMSAAAPQHILVDAATRQLANSAFQWQELPPLQVKGKRMPIEVALLERPARRSATRLQAPGYTLPMVGRHQQFAIARQLLARAIDGHAQVLLLCGEAGMGKSRLIAELLRSAFQQHITYYTGECRSYGQQAYQVWQSQLRALFKLVPDSQEREQIAQVHTHLQHIDPALLERAPLLGPLLNLSIPETALTRSLEGRSRQEAFHSLMLRCFQHWTRERPLLLILEDCHWIDELSAELLMAVAQHSSTMALMLLISHRPLDPTIASSHVTTQLQRLPHARAVQLTEFSPEETKELIRLRLEQRFGHATQVPVLLQERISAQAQGNPFYIDELLTLIQERGIDVHDPAALLAMTLPDSLQRLIISRIDQLEEQAKTTLKVASVIGRLFSTSWLGAIHPTGGDARVLQEHLPGLQQRDFIQHEQGEAEVAYLFKHILTREVAYESLALSTRMMLHQQLAEFIEAGHADDAEHYLDILAYHYGHSTNVAKQREYYWRAGKAAQAAFANSSAIHYFERLIPLQTEDEAIATQLALAEVLNFVGRSDAAMHHADSVLEWAQQRQDIPIRAQAHCLRSDILRCLARYGEALAALDVARADYLALNDQEGLLKTLSLSLHNLFYQGRYTDVLTQGMAFIELAERLGNYPALCDILQYMGSAYGEQEQYEESIHYFERGIAVATKHNVRLYLPALMSNLAASYIHLGMYAEAFKPIQATLTEALTIGYYTQVLICLMNLGVIYQEVGQEAECYQCLLTAFKLMGELPDPRWLGVCLTRMAGACAQQGDGALTEHLRTRAITIYRSCGARYYLALELDQQAEHYLREGRLAEAEASNTAALSLAQEVQVPTFVFNCEVRAVKLAVLRGQRLPADACAELAARRAACKHLRERALVADTLWQLDPHSQEARQEAATHYRALYARIPKVQYRQRYAALSGEWLPPPPVMPPPPSLVDENTLMLDEFLQRLDLVLVTMTESQ